MQCEVSHFGCFRVAFGFAVEACEVMPDLRVDRFDGGGERLSLQEEIARNDFAVHFPLIGGNGKGF